MDLSKLLGSPPATESKPLEEKPVSALPNGSIFDTALSTPESDSSDSAKPIPVGYSQAAAKQEESIRSAVSEGLDGIASIDMTEIMPTQSLADKLVAAATKFTLDNPDEFKAVCKALDDSIGADQRLDALDLGRVRNYVQSIMVTLQRVPEMRVILMDKDIRNCIAFARQQSEVANMNLSNAEQAKKARKTKSEPANKKRAAFAAAVDSLEF